MTPTEAYVQVRRHFDVWRGYPALVEVMRTFDDLRVYVAGGVVRNALMGISGVPKDFDFFLQGPSTEAAIACLRRSGRIEATPYGSPRWRPTDQDESYADLVPVVDFVPGLWPCEDIVDVLNQFDFTANAVAYDMRTGEVFDPQNGIRDAARRVMKMIRFDYPNGPYVPSANLDRNAVLWFRIVHYAGTLNLTFDSLTRNWLLSRRHYQAQLEEFARLFFRPDLRALEALDG